MLNPKTILNWCRNLFVYYRNIQNSFHQSSSIPTEFINIFQSFRSRQVYYIVEGVFYLWLNFYTTQFAVISVPACVYVCSQAMVFCVQPKYNHCFLPLLFLYSYPMNSIFIPYFRFRLNLCFGWQDIHGGFSLLQLCYFFN